jgi:hypothetical protein
MLYNKIMNEVRKDLGYSDEMPSEESKRAVRRILAGQPPNDPAPDWKLDEETKETGKSGLADTRTILNIKRKQSVGEPLTPQEERLIAKIHQQEQEE